MGLLAVIVGGLALSAGSVVKATPVGHCYVSGYIGVDAEAGGTSYAFVDGEALAGDSTPGGYDMTWFHAACNAHAVQIRIWPPSYTEESYCDDGYEWGDGCVNNSDTDDPHTGANLHAYNDGYWYNSLTVYGSVHYWDGFPGPSTGFYNSLSLQKTIDLGSPPEEDQPDECVPAGSYCTPILVPTTGSNRWELTSAADGVLFDIDGDGAREQISWTAAGAALAFLAIDKNGNGIIDDGSELFGDATVPGVTNGFLALSTLAGKKGPIRNTDPIFHQLLLWTDSNHDGLSQSGEIVAFSSLYSEIDTGYAGHRRRDGHGNLFRFVGSAVATYEEPVERLSLEKRKAKTRRIYDVIFVRQ